MKKNHTLKGLFTAILIATATIAFAQPGGGGGGQGGGGNPPGTGAPVDGGAVLLVLGVAVYSYKRSVKQEVNKD